MTSLIFFIVLGVLILLVLFSAVKVVSQNDAFVVERLGKYNTTIFAGMNIIIPFIDKIAYKHSLKENSHNLDSQAAITSDNVGIMIDGVLYTRIIDPKDASYGVNNVYGAITLLAQTTMRSEIGKLTLDEVLSSRENINANITKAIDEAAVSWGLKVLRYEVKDIVPPKSILDEMEKQMAAERERRVAVTTSEGYREAQINQAEGDRQSKILRAKGEAEAVLIAAKARADSIKTISLAIKENDGEIAVSQQLAEQYIDAFKNIAKETNVVLMPSDAGDVSNIVAKSFTTFNAIKNSIK